MTSPANYAAWATGQRRACLARLKSALDMKGSGFSYWPTPTASLNGNIAELVIEAGRARLQIPEGMHQTKGLIGATQVWTYLWEIMTALGLAQTAKGQARAAAMASFRPVSLSLRNGRHISRTAPKPNPVFMERLMGWPDGWTEANRSVTGFAVWLRRMRSALSNLPMPAMDTPHPGKAGRGSPPKPGLGGEE